MMRATRTPRALAGAIIATGSRTQACGHRRFVARIILVLAAMAVLAPNATFAQSSFPKPNGGMFGATPKVDNSLPLHLQGDELIYDTKGNKVIARGNVEIQYDGNNLTADEVIYDQSANTLSASGNVVLKQSSGNIIRAESYTLTDDFRDGFIQSLSVVAKDNSRISAEQGTRRDGNVTEFSNAKFTPCKSDGSTPPLWCIAARKVVHDQTAATISYEDAQFEMFGQPVLYLPYFQHADPSVKRKSGFLAPGYGHSEDLGFFTEIPYYFALAPNYDFTFTPMYMSEQGIMLQGFWRHRLADGQYSVKIAGLDQDGGDLPQNSLFTDARRAELDGFRGTLETKGDFSLSSWWSYGWDVTLESDDTFRRFYKFDNILLTDRVNNAYFKGQSERNYFATNFYHFGGLLLDDSNQSESRVHPVIDYNYVVDEPVLGGELKIDANALSFSRSDGVIDSTDQALSRVVARAKWRRRLTDTLGITYTPFAELRGDLYQYNNYRDPNSGLAVDNEQIARGLATGGATVSYPWIANSASASHVIEPIGQIVARQSNIDQNRLPDEDAKSLVWDDTNLFETSKFSGWDRLETGTRANVGVQYTFQAWSGGYARVLAGQSFHLEGENAYASQTITCDPDGAGPLPVQTVIAAGVDDDCNPIFNPRNGLESDKSDYVLGVYFAPTDAFRVISQTRFDDDDLSIRREDIAAAINYGPFAAQVAYSYVFNDPELGLPGDENQDISGLLGLRLTDQWSVMGALRYDIDGGQRLTDSLQIRYLDDCFMLSATYQETFITDTAREIEPDRTLMFRVEYKYLGGLNYKSDVLDHVFSDDQPLRN